MLRKLALRLIFTTAIWMYEQIQATGSSLATIVQTMQCDKGVNWNTGHLLHS